MPQKKYISRSKSVTDKSKTYFLSFEKLHSYIAQTFNYVGNTISVRISWKHLLLPLFIFPYRINLSILDNLVTALWWLRTDWNLSILTISEFSRASYFVSLFQRLPHHWACPVHQFPFPALRVQELASRMQLATLVCTLEPAWHLSRQVLLGHSSSTRRLSLQRQ